MKWCPQCGQEHESLTSGCPFVGPSIRSDEPPYDEIIAALRDIQAQQLHEIKTLLRRISVVQGLQEIRKKVEEVNEMLKKLEGEG